MTLRIRYRLFLLSAGSILAVLAVVGAFLTTELRSWLEDHTAAELLRLARTGRTVIEHAPGPNNVATLDPLADRLGRASGARVTIIAGDGRVLGDSALEPDEVVAVENHGRRPEVLQALAAGSGLARRHSDTLDTEMLYRAVPFMRDEQPGILRAAMSLAAVEQTVSNLHLLLLLAGLIALAVTLCISAASSHIVSRALRNLVSKARTAAGPGDEQAPPAADRGGSFSKLASDLEQTVSTLADERDRFGAVLTAMAEAVLVLDSQQRIDLSNPAARSLLRLPERHTGRSLIESVRAPELIELADGALEARSATVEFELPGPSPRHLLAQATPLRESGGAVIVLHDVTELRRLERVRRDFVANVSHELRTPVSIIRANAETLLDGALQDPERAQTFLGALVRSAERLSNLISDLLDIARIESGRLQMELRPVDLGQIVARAAETIGPGAAERHQQLDLRPDGTPPLLADAAALEQVLMNLMDNAVKYSPDGGRIRVSARTTAGQVRIEVMDEGPGIEPQHRARIFERFYRVDRGRSRAMGGTGLGLSIVKNLVESMGGEVGVEMAEPQGSVFWVRLPAAPAAEA